MSDFNQDQRFWESPVVNVSQIDAIYNAQKDIQENPASWDKSIFHYFEYIKRSGFGSVLDRLREEEAIVDYDIVNPDLVRSALTNAGLVFVTPSGVGASSRGGAGITTAQRIENMIATMRDAALVWNVRIDDQNLRTLATTAVENNFNDQQVMNSIGKWAVGQQGVTEDLAAGPLGEAMNELSRQYGVKISKATANTYLQRFVQGQETTESIKALLAKQATSLYPSLAERFSRGETFEDVVEPYREAAARLLEKDPSSFDFTATSLNKVLTYNPDGKTERQMSMGEFANYLRTNKEFGYEYTTDAKNKAYATVNALSSVFGRA